MVRLALLLLMLFWSGQAGAERAQVVAVYDGDTITVVVFDRRERIRLSNIDAPELGSGARCAREQAMAVEARDYLRMAVARARNVADLQFEPRRYDVYGRGLARVILNGTDIGEDMIALGLVRRWDGRRHPWC